MPYNTQWLIKNQILLSRYWGETTEDELRESLIENIKFVKSSDYHLVHSVTDVSRVTKVLPLMRSVQIIKEVATVSDNTGWTIVVGQKDPVLKFATNITRQFLNVRQASFDTISEAIDYLKEMDQSLDWARIDQTFLQDLLNS